MAGGRPTKYKNEYCDLLVNWMAGGLSFESFGSEVDASKQTLYTWTTKHPEFLDAKRVGTTKGQAFWEKLGRQAVVGKIPGFNATVWIFSMKNRFGWRDKQDIVTRDDTIKNVDEMDDQEIEERLDMAIKVVEKNERDKSGASRANSSKSKGNSKKKAKATRRS